jgi:3-deoxy-D-manno-octulosonic-acid transferase
MFWLWLYAPLTFIIPLILPLVSWLHPKLRQGLQMRRKQNGTRPWLSGSPGQRPIWFHCASGEFEYAKPVLREIKHHNPEQKILVTYFSPSVAAAVQACPEVDLACPMPWDTARHWRRFIHHHQPQALLIARTDLWPMMLHVTRQNSIPRLLFSKTVNPEKTGPLSFFAHSMMKTLTDIFCVSEEDQRALSKKLGLGTPVHAAGDTRYDQCLYRRQHASPLKPLKNFLRPVFVAGSTWVADELWLLQLMAKEINDVSFIVAPHEPTPEHLKRLQQDIEKVGLTYQKYSETASWNPQAILLIDQVGILADLYQWGQFAFVGGSVNRRVHSVMEPLAQGLLCFVGPEHTNNREALHFSQTQVQDMTPVQVVRSADELTRRFQVLRPSWTSDHQFSLQLEIKKKAGAAKIVHKWILNNT